MSLPLSLERRMLESLFKEERAGFIPNPCSKEKEERGEDSLVQLFVNFACNVLEEETMFLQLLRLEPGCKGVRAYWHPCV